MPKISFLGCTYNNDAYIADAIESLLHQTEQDMEVIYVNDGSTDGTRDILEYYKRKDSRVKCLHLKENQGISKAWNQGVPLAQGDIIGVISGDDVYVPTRGETHIRLSAGYSEVITYGSYLRSDSCLRPFTGTLMDGSEAGRCIVKPYEKGCLDVKQTIPHGFMSLSKSLAQRVPMRELLKVGCDYPFLKDLEAAGANFRHTEEVLGVYRHHSKMVSMNRRREIDNSTREAGGDSNKSYGGNNAR